MSTDIIPEVVPETVQTVPYLVVIIPVSRDAQWWPKKLKSVPPVLESNLTLDEAAERVANLNRKIVADQKRHIWHIVIRIKSEQSGFGIAKVSCLPENYPDSLTAVPPWVIVKGLDGLPMPAGSIRSVREVMRGQNHTLTLKAWYPRVWHMLAPVV